MADPILNVEVTITIECTKEAVDLDPALIAALERGARAAKDVLTSEKVNRLMRKAVRREAHPTRIRFGEFEVSA